MVFQDPYSSLNPRLTALGLSPKHVASTSRFLGRKRGTKPFDPRKHGHPAARRDEEAASTLRRTTPTRQRGPGTLREPSVLVADEPTSAIDQSAQAQLLNLFSRLIRAGLSIILISHDLAVVRYLARRVYVMRDGEFVEERTNGADLRGSAARLHPHLDRLHSGATEDHRPPDTFATRKHLEHRGLT